MSGGSGFRGGYSWESGLTEVVSNLFLRVSPRVITPPTEYSACTEFARAYSFLSRVVNNIDSAEFSKRLKLPIKMAQAFRTACSGLITADSGQWIMLTASLKALGSQSPDYSPICSHITMLIERLKGGANWLVVPFCIRIHSACPPEWSVLIITNLVAFGMAPGGDKAAGTYALSIVNVAGYGRGGEYHQCKLGKDGLLQDAVLTVTGVKLERLTQPAFWFSLFRLGAHPNKDNFDILYKTLVHYLSDKPHYSHWSETSKLISKKNNTRATDTPSVWVPLPRDYSPGTPMSSAFACLEFMIKLQLDNQLIEGEDSSSTYSITKWIVLLSLLFEVKEDIKSSSSMDSVDGRLSPLLSASSRLLANIAFTALSEYGAESPLLTKDMISALGNASLKLANDIFVLSEGEKFFPSALARANNDTTGDSSLWQFAGLFTGESTEIGDKARHSLILPVNLSSVGMVRPANLEEYCVLLRKTSQICLLLFNQRVATPLAPNWAFYLIRHVTLELGPVDCADTSYAAMKESIALLHLVARYFLIACAGIAHNKHMLADRAIILASMLSTAHQILTEFDRPRGGGEPAQVTSAGAGMGNFDSDGETPHTDKPCIDKGPLELEGDGRISAGPRSALCFAHFYSGSARGCIGQFSVDIPGFSQATGNYVFSDPALTMARSKICRWLSRCKKERLLFEWGREGDGGLRMGVWDEELVGQLSLAFGFEGDYAKYFVGGDEAFSNFFPELSQLRDLAFFAKYYCCSDSPDSLLFNTPVGSYGLYDVTPQWDVQGNVKATKLESTHDKSPKSSALQGLEYIDSRRIVRRSDDVTFLSVKMFGSHVKMPGESSGNSNWLKNLKWWGGKNRMPNSSAHPIFFLANSALANSDEADTSRLSKLAADSETDILYLPPSPVQFPNAMAPRDVELFLQYLTAPYVRIPLVLGFFNTESKITLLDNHAVQQSLWSALFEPGGERQESHAFSVPATDRGLLGTALGLLANELKWSPESIFKPLIRIFTHVLESSKASSPLSTNSSLPFCARLTAYVLRYASQLRHDISFAGCTGPLIDALTRLLAEGREVLWRRANKCIEKMKIPEACAAMAHIAIAASTAVDKRVQAAMENGKVTDGNAYEKAVDEIGVCLLFLFNHFKFGDVDASISALGMPESELFALFQRVRADLVLRWAGQLPATAGGHEDHRFNVLGEDLCRRLSDSMRVVTLERDRDRTGLCGGWISIGSRLYLNISQHRGEYDPLGVIKHKKKMWSKLSMRLKGRREVIKSLPGQFYYDYLCESNKLSSIQIDLDFMTLLVGDSKIRLVPEWVNNFASFTDNFGRVSSKNPMQCSVISIAQNRTWLRLLGKGINHDLVIYRGAHGASAPPAGQGLPALPEGGHALLLRVFLSHQVTAPAPEWGAGAVRVRGRLASHRTHTPEELGLSDHSDKFAPPSMASTAARVYNNLVNITSSATNKAMEVAQALWEDPRKAEEGLKKQIRRRAFAHLERATGLRWTLALESESEEDIGTDSAEKEETDAKGGTGGTGGTQDQDFVVEFGGGQDAWAWRAWQLLEWGGRTCRVLAAEGWGQRDPSRSLAAGALGLDLASGERWLYMELLAPSHDGSSIALLRDGGLLYADPPLLRGYLPHHLTETYSFWRPVGGDGPKSETTLLVGHPKRGSEAAGAIEVAYAPAPAPSALGPGPEHALWRVTRRCALRGRDATLSLVDVARYADGNFKHSWAARALMELEALSHLLAWGEAAADVSLFELPRLGLTFVLENGRFYCQEHAGLYLSRSFSRHCGCVCGDTTGACDAPLSEAYWDRLDGADAGVYSHPGCVMCGGTGRGLLEGLAKSVILQDEENCVKVLLSCIARPVVAWNSEPRMEADGAPSQLARLLSPLVVWDYHDPAYLEATKSSRYFIFGLHASRAFLSSPGPQADLWLLLLRLLGQQYAQACRMIPGLSVDCGDPASLAWISAISAFNSLNTPHPDFLKVQLLLVRLGVFGPASGFTVERYFATRQLMDADCTFSGKEELQLIESAPCSDAMGLHKSRLTGRPFQCPPPKSTLRALSGCSAMPEFHLSHSYPLDTSFLSTFRVKRQEDALSGHECLSTYDKMLQRGISVADMLILYQLMTGQFRSPVGSEEDEGYYWGVVLFYHLIFTDSMSGALGAKEGAFLFNLLGLMAGNRSLAASGLPVAPQVRKKGIGGLLPFRSPSPLIRFIAELKEKTAGVASSADTGSSFVGTRGAVGRAYRDIAEESLGSLFRCSDFAPAPGTGPPPAEPADGLERWRIAGPGLEGAEQFLRGCVVCPLEALARDATVRRTQRLSLEGYRQALAGIDRACRGRPVVGGPFAPDEQTGSRTVVELVGFEESVVGVLFTEANLLGACVARLQHIKNELLQALRDDFALQNALIKKISLRSAGEAALTDRLAECCRARKTLKFSELAELTIDSGRVSRLLMANPRLGAEGAGEVLTCVALVMLTVNRRALVLRAMSQLRHLLAELRVAASCASHAPSVLASARTLADTLTTRRHYVTQSSGACVLDARFLSFEFAHNLILRENQVELVRKLVAKVHRGESLCHQLMMGQGKTSVVSPLLSMCLADGERLVVHVSPQSLLEFTRNTFQQKFSSITNKGVFTFLLTRYDKVTPELASRFAQTRSSGSLVLTTPLSIKSLFLKALELAGAGAGRGAETTELACCISILRHFSDAVLIMDEVDQLLHPLKSELHWPVGPKLPLPDAEHNVDEKVPFRWYLPWHLIEGFLFCSGAAGSLELPAVAKAACRSLRGREVIARLRLVIARGVGEFALAACPHVAVLNAGFYRAELLPVLYEWAALALTSYGLPASPAPESPSGPWALVDRWLQAYLPHILGKVNRVSYGLLSPAQLDAYASSAQCSNSRCLLAVPFVGKDTPSKNSEFSHPDVLIGLTVLAYRFQGLRPADFYAAVQRLLQDFSSQPGPPRLRPAYFLFRQWIAGGRGDGPPPPCQLPFAGLDLFNIEDREHVELGYELLRNSPLVIRYYLHHVVFPMTMRHATKQLTATAQELASSILFRVRLGFSGTPSALLPADMGRCEFSRGSDSHMLRILTDPAVVLDAIYIAPSWSPRWVLQYVATSSARPLALIDAGALVTGLTNYQVR